MAVRACCRGRGGEIGAAVTQHRLEAAHAAVAPVYLLPDYAEDVFVFWIPNGTQFSIVHFMLRPAVDFG